MTFYTATFIKGNIVFSDGTSRKAYEKEVAHFLNRPTLLAYDCNGEKKLIYWADLHRHSGYSLMDSSTRIGDMVEHTEFAGALTDHGNMRGSLEYYKAMKAAGKFPIIGEEFYANSIDGKKACNHLILLAKTWKGYRNLTKLSTLAYTNFYSKPQLNLSMLQKYHDGLICLSACLSGEVARALIARDGEKAEKVVETYHQIFGNDYYLEIQRHGLDQEKIVNPGICKMAQKYGIHPVATTDSHYTLIQDSDIHQILLCIGTRTKLESPGRHFSGSGYYLHNIYDMEKKFSDLPESLDGTLEVLQKCASFEIVTGDIRTPAFPVPLPFASEEEYFLHLCREGAKKRYPNGMDKTHEERAQFEADTIKGMKYCGYFLIVQDFLNWAKCQGIPVGPGRGSAVGSLVAYILGITDIDPLNYGLLFERFLNPERISMPDIDSDFSKRDRSKVIEYVRQKYGNDCVSKIIDISRECARVVVRDVSRVLGKPYSFSDQISKAIPDIPNISMDAAMEQSEELRKLYRTDAEVQKVWEYAKRLEGLPRGVSVHACGILISPSEVSDYMPQELATDRETGEKAWVTQYPGPQCEEMGLLKMDFLGLRTLDASYDTIDLINRETGHHLSFDDIPLNDPRVYKSILKQKRTGGVFQVESPGMQKLLHQMYYDVKVDDTAEKGNEYFERLIAAIALYRPGPMDEIPQYLHSMQTGNIRYDTPELENILRSTYGVLVYQEQAMMIVRKLAGFSKGQSDIIRKGMAKKKKAIMKEYGEYFLHGSTKHDSKHPDKILNIKGCIANGISENTAKTIWDKMEKFGAYAFNKSHACAYAHLTIRTAWLSKYYPEEFMKCTLDSYSDSSDKIEYYAGECKKNKIRLLPPDINDSRCAFKVEPFEREKAIRYSLRAINGIGDTAALAIEKERTTHGVFVSLDNLLMRLSNDRSFSAKTVSCLNDAGALDRFPGTRAAKDAAFPSIEQRIKTIRNTDFNQMSLFDTANSFRLKPLTISSKAEYSMGEIAEKEQKALGFVFNWPTIPYRSMLKQMGKNILAISDIPKKRNLDKSILFIGIAKDLTHIDFPRGGGMLRFKAEDEYGKIPCIAFDSARLKIDRDIANNEVCYLKGILKNNPKYGIQIEIDGSFLLEHFQKRAAISKAI